MDHADTLRIDVAYAPTAGDCELVTLQLPAGAALSDALRASGLLERHGLVLEGLRLGVWSKPREPQSLLRDGDRVEVYRQLKVDPKEARRQRYQQHRESQAARDKLKAEKAARASAAVPPAAVAGTGSEK